MNPPATPYRSFWMAGFEGADHRNASGVPLDMSQQSGHASQLDGDYALAAGLGLRTVRESIGWRLAEPSPGRFALQRVERVAAAAQRAQLQVLWSLMHYGIPDDLSLHDDTLIPRFADFAAAVARRLAPLHDTAPVYTPINEIGFLAWAASATSMMWPHRPALHSAGAATDTAPDDITTDKAAATAEAPEALAAGPTASAQGSADAGSSLHSGYALKRRLVRAALAAMEAIRAEDPRARFLHIEPLVHVVAPQGMPDRPDLTPLADTIASYQWQVWDMLAGRLEPALGGSEAALDLIGVNHYAAGQWEALTERRLGWQPPDPRRRAPALLLADAWQRYGRPLLLAETSDAGEARPQWLDHIAANVDAALAAGVPVAGICLYPLIDRPDWDDAQRWHRSGLFDVTPPRCKRHPHAGYLAALTRWQRRLPPPQQPKESPPMPTLLVFSHLRWGFVYQRPQQLMSRLARHWRVVFVEEPVQADGPPAWRNAQPAPGVEVWCPQTPLAAPGFHDDQLPLLRAMLEARCQAEGIADPVVWFYTPMALPLAAGLQPAAVVYDCMDELSAFRGAPRQMLQREAALMQQADLVLAGGPSLYETRRGRHPNLHCLPSAVDGAHFAPARLLADSIEGRTVAALHAGIAKPRLGFFGVIDERLDLALVAALADAQPQWQWVMAGPVVKIDPASLPQRPNLHWLGMQPYSVLPYLAASWDVCIMPFAINEATRFISPTKTLEYMAAERPVVSTPIHDVAVLYGSAVEMADTPQRFVDACRRLLHEAPAARSRRQLAMAALVQHGSWDACAARIHELLVAAVAETADEAADQVADQAADHAGQSAMSPLGVSVVPVVPAVSAVAPPASGIAA